MNDVRELFATLTCCLEDLHSLAAEGQAVDQPHELLLILAEQICNGLYHARKIVDQVETAIGAS
jgi:hypothetical protein